MQFHNDTWPVASWGEAVAQAAALRKLADDDFARAKRIHEAAHKDITDTLANTLRRIHEENVCDSQNRL